jgi:antitoxin HicB
MPDYPVILTPDDNGTLLVTSPDFPELVTFGDTVADALQQAQGALLEAIAARLADGEPIPQPSAGPHVVHLPEMIGTKDQPR